MSWMEQKLGELVTLKQGFALNVKSKHYIVEKGIPLLKISDLFNNTETIFVNEHIPKQFLVYEDEIIYTRTAQVGYAFMGKRGVIYNNCFKVIPDEKLINKEFLYLWLNSKAVRTYAQTLATGTAQQDLNHGAFKSIKINLPPLKTQQKIATLLSNYDKLIENNTQRIKVLESMAEELYKEWFVRLRFPGHEDVEVVDGVPEGWERAKISKYLKYHRGKSYSSEDIAGDTGLPFINLKCINRNGGFRRDGIKVFNGEYKDSNVAYEGDIVMAVTDMTQDRAIVGRVAKAPKMGENKYIVSMDLVKIEPLDIKKDFLYALLRFSGIGYILKEFANGVNVLHLTPDMIYLQKAIVPSKELQIKFETIFSPILEKIDTLNLKNDVLKQTRNLLLPRLMSGKLNVEDFDII